MKKVLPLLLFFLLTEQLTAQVGINTTTPDAILDIRSGNAAAPTNQDGLLIPKINTFPAINPTAAQNGMLVFLTTTAGANPPGFYYWDNATGTWKGVGNDNTKWGLTGNTGTSSATHFIGTSDNQDVVFKRQGIQAGLLNVGNTAFGVDAMLSPTGNFNAAFGTLSLQDNTSGIGNTAIGAEALSNTTTGGANTALGYRALRINTAGGENVAVGQDAISSTGSGSGNTAVGFGTLSSIIGAGTFGNVALGHRAGSNLLNGNNNIFIGSSANAPNNNTSNQLNIGNTIFGSIGATKNIGINTNAPKGMLDVNSATSGVLIPRVALTSAVVEAPIVNPQGGGLAESTLVYNTAIAGIAPNNVLPGFYYWDSTKWLRLDADAAKNRWNLTGNAGTSSATNFIGTTDDQDIIFKRNNFPAGKIANGNTFLGHNAGAANTGSFNTFLGTGAGESNISGSRNIYVGRYAGRNGVMGSDNLFFGYGAGIFTTGNNNLFMGSFAGNSTSNGTLNVFLGDGAGINNITGSANVLVGGNARPGATNLANSTAIGTNAMVSASNAMVLGSIAGINSALASTSVAIGTTTPSAVLDVSSATNGILIPRVSLTSAATQSPITNPTGGPIAESTLVYNTATAGAAPNNVIPGFYYWNGLKWLRVDAEEAKNKWSLTGNSGTNPTTHFIGTTDFADVVFKRNNQPSGRLNTSSTSFGYNALSAGTPANCAAFGAGALSVSTGTSNTAVGAFAMGSNTTGGSNTAVGRLALEQNITGNDNVAIGELALNVADGNSNTGIGNHCDILSGHNGSTAIGAQTFIESDNATAVGFQAVVRADNSLVLGSIAGQNGATASVNVGVGTATPANALHISRGDSNATPNTNARLLIEDDAATYQQFLTPSNVDSGLLFGNNLGSVRGALLFNVTTNPEGLLFRTGGNTNRMAITNVGDVGIGTIAPNANLEVSGTAERTARITSTNAATVNIDLFRTGAGAGDWRIRNTGGELHFVRSDDDFATAPDEQCRITLSNFRPGVDNTKSLGTSLLKWTALFATNGVIQTSDANDKQNIASITGGLEKIMQLNPVSFEWKERRIDNHSEHLGFIAQEVQRILPAVVADSDWVEQGEGKDPIWQKSEKLGMKYAEIIPVLVKAVQEQQHTIESQNKQLSALTEANRKLQQQLETHDRALQQILNRLPEKQ